MRQILNSIYKRETIDQYRGSDTGIIRLFNLYLKTVYSTNVGKILIIFSPMLVALSLSMMFPPFFSIGVAQVFVTSLSSGVIWGMTYFSIRRTTIYNNMQGTRISKIKIYVAIWLVMLFVTFWSEVSYWGTTIILEEIGIKSLFEIVLSLSYTFDMKWIQVDWITIGYTWFVSVTLMFVASFIARWVFRTEQQYFIVLFIYVLSLIPFGGILRPFMTSENDLLTSGIQITKDIDVVMAIGMLLPQYHLDLFNFAAISAGTIVTHNGVQGTLGGLKFLDSFKWSSDWKWNFTIIYPIAFGILLIPISYATLDIIE